MFTLLKLAFRNLTRNKRRTIITVAAVSGGLGLFMMSVNLATGMYRDMIDQGISMLAGHVVVQGQGYQQSRDLDTFVPDAEAAMTTLRQEFPEAHVVPRTLISGLLNSTTNSVGVAATAIDPELESRVSDWHDKIVEGEFLDGDDGGIIVGVGLAETLGVELGDKVVMMAQGKDDVSSRLFRVRGMFKTGSSEMDGFFALIPLKASYELTGRPNQVTQVALHLPDPDATAEAHARAQAVLEGPEVEVLDWKQAIPEIWQMVRADSAGNNLFLVVMGIMVAMGVLNTILMSVMERIREFGVMLAVGVTPRQLAGVILLEGLLLGVISSVVGTALGVALSWPIVYSGLDLSSFVGGNFDMAGVTIDPRIYAAWDYERMAWCVGLAMVFCVVAAIYPARKAAKLKPVEAMHHV